MSNRLQALSLTLVLALISIGARAEQVECEPAVDMIEANDAVNRISECDYRDEGLNGWLANLGAKDEPEKPKAAESVPAPEPVPEESAEKAGFVLQQPFSDPLGLVQARFAIVQQAAARCTPQRANLVTQAYKTDEQQTLLVMQFRCEDGIDD